MDAASVFGEQKKLEPMPAERKAKWKKEIECLLSVTDHIVEFVPSQQQSKDGTYMEVTALSLYVLPFLLHHLTLANSKNVKKFESHS